MKGEGFIITVPPYVNVGDVRAAACKGIRDQLGDELARRIYVSTEHTIDPDRDFEARP